MNKAQQASVELRAMDELAAQDSPMHRLSPLSKLFVTVLYIVVTVSFHKYDISGVFVMVLFPLAGYPVGVSGGVISMLTLMMKGIFCLMASFLLAATTSIEDICRALRQLHVPKVLTSLLLLTFRYISVLLDEAAIMTDAYRLRAPGQKGVHISAWGSFLGQLLLRSMDRATALYESMELRGYHGEFHYAQGRPSSRASWPFAIGCAALIVLARLYNLPALLGGLFA